MSNICPVCQEKLEKSIDRPDGRDATCFSCPLCGVFILSRTLISSLPAIIQKNKDASAKISHAIRMMQQVNKGTELYTTTVNEILK